MLPATDETFSIIHDETLRLNRLVEDLRTLSLADSGELPLALREVEPRALLERAVTAHAPLAEERGVVLEMVVAAGNMPIVVDADRMAQVLDNLLSNALRYTPDGGRVTLSSRSVGQDVLLSVRDTGEGISAEHLPHIFNRFYRADQSRQRDNGSSSGLGLAISKSVVEQHGGTISVESATGHGTTFTVTLPIAHKPRTLSS